MTWGKLAVLAVLLGIIVLLSIGLQRSERKRAEEREQWAEERTAAAVRSSEALNAEIDKRNALEAQLETVNAESTKLRQRYEDAAKAASDAVASATRSASRLRDAIETNRLSTRAALDAAGVAKQCEASEASADLLRGVLQRLDAATSELGDAARTVGGFADSQTAAASECARRYEVAR